MLRRIESFSPEDVFCAEEERKGFACGLGALTAVLWAARELGADTVKVLRHATSGDVTGDYSSGGWLWRRGGNENENILIEEVLFQ